MSENAVPLLKYEPTRAEATSFVAHAKLIGTITFLSRILGLAREVVAANFFGAGAVWSAFQYAFTIPNLFRKLLGEGALSAAFIPLYAKAVKQTDRQAANEFASASVSLLISILIAITVVGELVLAGILLLAPMRDSTQLAVKLTLLMLPYVVFVCGAAFLGGILQVHRRFTAATATSIMSNLLMIIALVLVAMHYDLKSDAGQTAAVWWIALAVIISGVAQVAMLVPSLKAAGFRFHFVRHFWTAAIKQMLLMSIPVALGAGVLQLGVVLDKQIALMLAAGDGKTTMHVLGAAIRLPMQEGALARLNWAQFLYQFPLGVFAIALATAIFPQIADDALDAGRDRFKSVLRQGIEAALFIGLPASAGMLLVALPAVRFLFERGQFTAHDSFLTARSAAIYSAAIWAFSLQQILNRAYYALHDMKTPLIWAAVNLAINLIVELPLVWTGLGESGMAVGTLVSFAIQAVAMLWMLDRRVGGIGLRASAAPIGKMVIATLVMAGACAAIMHLPFFPDGGGKLTFAAQLGIIMTFGGVVYFAICAALGLDVTRHLRRRAARSPSEAANASV
jgi:putative peptidoglycan lipid II flippase